MGDRDAMAAGVPMPEPEPVAEQPFSTTWDGRHIVVSPGDKLVINLGPNVDMATVEGVRDRIMAEWPDIGHDLMVISAETNTVIEA